MAPSTGDELFALIIERPLNKMGFIEVESRIKIQHQRDTKQTWFRVANVHVQRTFLQLDGSGWLVGALRANTGLS